MKSSDSKGLALATTGDQANEPYSSSQLGTGAAFVRDVLGRSWFGGAVEPGSEYFLVPLVLGVYSAYQGGKLPTKTEASAFMPTQHASTLQRYLTLAQELGLVKVAPTSPEFGDRRKHWVYPTERMLILVEDNLSAILDDIRRATAALVIGGQKMPKTGAPILTIESIKGMRKFKYLQGQEWPLADRTAEDDAEGYANFLKGQVMRFSETIRLCPENVPAYMNRAIIYTYQRDYERAIGDYTRAIELNRADPPFVWRGKIYAYSGRKRDALNDFNAAIEYAPTADKYLIRAWFLLEEMRDFDHAIEDCSEALKREKSVGAYQLRSRAYEAKADYGKARADCQMVLELEPSNEEARRRLQALRDAKDSSREQISKRVRR